LALVAPITFCLVVTGVIDKPMGAPLLAVNRDKVSASAQKLLQSGKYDKAILELKKLVDDDPKDVRTLLKLGDTYVKMGARADAIGAYQLVANVYADQGFFLKAVAVYKQMLRVDASVATIHLKLAEMYQQLGLANDSMQHYQQVAVLYEQQGKTAESLDVLKRMVDLDPENLPSRIKLAELFAKVGRQAEATAEFRSAAEYLKQAERLDDYVRVAERLVFFEPNALDVTRELAQVYLSRGEAKAALGKLQLCFKTDPRNLDVLALIAEAFLAMEQVAKTISVYKEMARILESSSQHDEAQRHWRRVLELVPDDGESQQALGLVGVPTVPTVVAAPISPQVSPEEEQLARLLTETDVYMKYGLRDKALEHLQRVFALRPQHIEAHVKLRDIHQAMGNRPGLVDALRRLIAIGSVAGDPRTDTWSRDLQLLDGSSPRRATPPPIPAVDDELVLLDDGLAVEDSMQVDAETDFAPSHVGGELAHHGAGLPQLPPDEDLSGVGDAVGDGVDSPAYANDDDEYLLVSGPSDAYDMSAVDKSAPAAVGLPVVEDGAYEAFGSDTGAFQGVDQRSGAAGLDAFDEVGDFLGDAMAREQPSAGGFDDEMQGYADGVSRPSDDDELMNVGASLDTVAAEAMRLLDEGFDVPGAYDAPRESDEAALGDTDVFGDGGLEASPAAVFSDDPFASVGDLPAEFGKDAPSAEPFASTEIMSLSPEELAGLRAMARGPNPPSLVPSDEAPATDFMPVTGVASASLLQSTPDRAIDDTGFDDGGSYAEPDASPIDDGGEGEFGDSTLAMALPDMEAMGYLSQSGAVARPSTSLSEEARAFDDDGHLARDADVVRDDGGFETESTLDGGGNPFGGDDFGADLGDIGLLGDEALASVGLVDDALDAALPAIADAADSALADEFGLENDGFAPAADTPFVDTTAAMPLALASDEFSFVSDEGFDSVGEVQAADTSAPADESADPPADDKPRTPKLGVSEQARGFEDDPAGAFFPEELEEAEFFIKQELLDEAKEILLEIQESVPESARVVHMLARIAAKENDEPEPPAPWEMKIIAEVAEELGDLVDAVADVQPHHEMQVSVEEVLEQFKRGVKEAIGDDDAETHYNLGIAYREMGLIDEAISEFEIAARAPAKAPDAYHLMGVTHADHGRHDDALAAFDSALAALGEGGNGVAKKQRGVNEYQRGICFEALKKPGEALQAYRRARELGADLRDLGDRITNMTERLVGDDPGVPLGSAPDEISSRKKNIDYL
jgi:tetratricopeptide (TPR) repeat protein